MMEEEEYEQAITELADAARAGLRWIPMRTGVLDGADNPTRVRLVKALREYDRLAKLRSLREVFIE